MIINSTYFKLPPLALPNVTNNPSVTGNTPSLKNQLDATIERVEFDLLNRALGYDQYNEFVGYIDASGDIDPVAPQKWKDLLNGKDEWKGLRWQLSVNNKQSLIAYAVYCEVLKNQRQFFTTTGVVVPDSANAVTVNPTEEYVTMWNTFVSMYQGNCEHKYLNFWNPIFFEWNGYPYYEGKDDFMSLKQFLASAPDDYDSSFFKLYPIKNSLGL